MTILEYYKEKHTKDVDWKEKFSGTGKSGYCKIFQFLGQNFRNLLAFEGAFRNFLEYDNVPRIQWEKKENTGQEKAKHWTVNMQSSKFFINKNGLYAISAKGRAFKDLISRDYDDDEKWFVLYLLLLNSYFVLLPNYIIKKTYNIIESISEFGYSVDFIKNKLKEYINEYNKLTSADRRVFTFRQDLFWILSFYKDPNFIELFKISTEEEKRCLYDYVVGNLQDKTYLDVISYKYQNSGSYQINTFLEECKILYFTMIVDCAKIQNLDEYVNLLYDEYCVMYPLRERKVIDFVVEYSNIFNVIYKEIKGGIEEDIIGDFDYSYGNPEEDPVEDVEKIDDTDSNNEEKLRKVSTILKRVAKERSQYRCELEDLNMCKYFTSKDSSKNYLEIHHLIPREFSNEYDKSIEVLGNYIALCPHCHRLLHFAVDRERNSALTYLFNKHKDELRKLELLYKDDEKELKKLKEFYHIDCE